MNRITRFVSASLLSAVLAACGAGGSTTTPATSSSAIKFGTFGISIAIPKKRLTSAVRMMVAGRKPHYISVSTQSIAISLATWNGGTPPAGYSSTVSANTTAGSGNCGQDTGATGGLVCHLTMTAPIGMDAFEITAYEGLNATGNILSNSITPPQSITTGTNTVSMTLSPVVAKIVWSLPPEVTGNGTIFGAAIGLNLEDAANNLIVPTAAGCTNNCNYFTPPYLLQADGQTPDFVAVSCSNQSVMNLFTSNALSTVANGFGTLSNGTSISTPVSTLSSGTVTAVNGSIVHLVGNNIGWVYYSGAAQANGTGSESCTATDSQGLTATFTLSLQNGTVNIIIN